MKVIQINLDKKLLKLIIIKQNLIDNIIFRKLKRQFMTKLTKKTVQRDHQRGKVQQKEDYHQVKKIDILIHNLK